MYCNLKEHLFVNIPSSHSKTVCMFTNKQIRFSIIFMHQMWKINIILLTFFWWFKTLINLLYLRVFKNAIEATTTTDINSSWQLYFWFSLGLSTVEHNCTLWQYEEITAVDGPTWFVADNCRFLTFGWMRIKTAFRLKRDEDKDGSEGEFWNVNCESASNFNATHNIFMQTMRKRLKILPK